MTNMIGKEVVGVTVIDADTGVCGVCASHNDKTTKKLYGVVLESWWTVTRCEYHVGTCVALNIDDKVREAAEIVNEPIEWIEL